MIETATVRAATAVVYGVAFLGLAAATRIVPAGLRRYCYPLVAVVGLAGVSLSFQLWGVGAVTTAHGTVFVSTLVSQTVAYTVLYGAVTRLAGVSYRLTAVIVGVALLPTYVSRLGGLIDGGSLFTLVSLASFVVPFPVLAYLFLRPIWRSAQEVSRYRRLLHWKTRNVILFLYGMLLVYIAVVLGGLVADPVISELLLRYTALVFNVGIPAFLIHELVTDGDRLVAELQAPATG
ncbi:MAG: hypothetical protein ABEI75_03445 [Halobaculum sp.]